MAWSILDVHSPRPDIRPPWFSKGPSFGPVPHTRVFIQSTQATGDYAWMNDGVVVPWFVSSQGGGNQPFISYAGRCSAGGRTWRVAYTWQSVDVGSFECLLRVAVISEDLQEISNWWATVVNPTIASTFQLEQNTSTQIPGTPLGVTKREIPEWAEPLKKWPAAHLANIPLGTLG